MWYRMQRVLPLCAVMVASLLAGCGGIAPRPISAQKPLYLLTVDGQQLQLDVISRPSYQLAGDMPLGSVGSTPPDGAVGLLSSDAAIVTHTAAAERGTQTVKAATMLCALTSGSCQTVLDGWGSATVNIVNHQVAVPIWNGLDTLHGELALLSQASSKVTSRLHLPNLLPGPMQVGSDGKSLYWVTGKIAPDGSGVAYELDRVDLSSLQVTATYSFGQMFPSDLAIGPDGSIYVPIMYANLPGKSNSAPTNPQSGVEVEVFQPDLTATSVFHVGQNPNAVAVSAANGGSLAVIYAGSSESDQIDVYSLSSHALVQRIPAPDQSTITYLSTLADGDYAAVGTRQGRAIIGVFSSHDTQALWNNFAGTPIAAVAG